ncbi:hypothetical protein N9S30_00295 [bacterium]|nr:hypothetical protein [bacterium]
MAEQTEIETWFESLQSRSEVVHILDLMTHQSREITNYNRLVDFLSDEGHPPVKIQPTLDEFEIVERHLFNRCTTTLLRDSFTDFLNRLERTLARQNVVNSPRKSIHDLIMPIVKDRLVDALLGGHTADAVTEIELIKIEFCGILSSLERGALVSDAKKINKFLTALKTIDTMVANQKTTEKVATFARQNIPNLFHVLERLKLFHLYAVAELTVDLRTPFKHGVTDSGVFLFFSNHGPDVVEALESDLRLIEVLSSSANNDATLWHGIHIVETPPHKPSPEHPSLVLQQPSHVSVFETPTGKVHVIDSDDDVVVSTAVARLVHACLELVKNGWLPVGKIKASKLLPIIETDVIPRLKESIGELTHDLIRLASEANVTGAHSHASIGLLVARHQMQQQQQQAHEHVVPSRLHRTPGGRSSLEHVSESIAAQGNDLLTVPDYVSMPLEPCLKLVNPKKAVEYSIVVAIGNSAWVNFTTSARNGATVVTIEDVIKRARYTSGLKALSYSSLCQTTALTIRKLIRVGAEGAQRSSIPFNVCMAPGEQKGESLLTIGHGAMDRVLYLFVYLVHRVKVYLDEGIPLPVAVEWS